MEDNITQEQKETIARVEKLAMAAGDILDGQSEASMIGCVIEAVDDGYAISTINIYKDATMAMLAHAVLTLLSSDPLLEIFKTFLREPEKTMATLDEMQRNKMSTSAEFDVE